MCWCPKQIVFGPKRKCIVDEDGWSVAYGEEDLIIIWFELQKSIWTEANTLNNHGIFPIHRGTLDKDMNDPSHHSPLLKARGV